MNQNQNPDKPNNNGKMKEFVAHSENKEKRKHLLKDHLVGTATLASEFAKPFNSANVGYVLGLFHDLGKINQSFQEYLEACEKGLKQSKVPHSICGSAYLFETMRKISANDIHLAICSLGHHSGLTEVATAVGKLNEWWKDSQNISLKKGMNEYLSRFNMKNPEALPQNELRREFRLRMLFSALVDADYLDTEKHFDFSNSSLRNSSVHHADLWPIFRRNQLYMMWQKRTGTVNQIRKQVYFSCIESGKQSPGVFRLTVPTGGGKTRSSLGFALSHALANKRHGFRRIIVALPYTSIIDQNAKVYREIFGDHFVLEHHSQYEIPEDERQNEDSVRQRLATENWDYPLIVTTTVQLFESLFANKPGQCRKLHNIAKSILILDEVQTLPPELLKPTMDVLRTLVDEYGITLVLSTATQPSFDNTPYLDAFNDIKITEIVPGYTEHFKTLERVDYQPICNYESLTDLVKEIAKPEVSQVLVIMNTRKHALSLYKELLNIRKPPVEGLYHLSTLLCGAHRKKILSEIIERLENNLPVRLISTQVVEAGVDLDFPVVYRAIGPLDRIVQAAGRCNREGKRDKGKVIIFDFPENASHKGTYKIGLDDAKVILDRIRPEELHNPDIYTKYFQMLFRDCNLDKKEIQSYRHDLNFPVVAEKYKLIEDTLPVVITTYDNGEGARRLNTHLVHPLQKTFRKLLPYIVNIRRCELQREDINQCVEEAAPGLYKWIGVYDEKTHQGIKDILHDPSDLVI